MDGSRVKEGDGLVASGLRQTVSLQAPHPSPSGVLFAHRRKRHTYRTLRDGRVRGGTD
jgi:hypothetical protein